MIGHEASGTVVDVGSAVTSLKPGRLDQGLEGGAESKDERRKREKRGTWSGVGRGRGEEEVRMERRKPHSSLS